MLTHYKYSTYYNSIVTHINVVISNYSQILVYNQWSGVKLQLDTITQFTGELAKENFSNYLY